MTRKISFVIKSLLLVAFCTSSAALLGQTQEEIIQNRIEFISEQMEDEDMDLTDVVDVLNQYYEHKINLNGATAEELRSLMLLTDIQINDLLLHVKRFGKLISLYELQSLRYWDMNTIQLILPFVMVDDKLLQAHFTFKDVIKYGKFDAFLRYQRTPEHKSGYDKIPLEEKKLSSKYYYGNPDKYYTRLRYTYRNNISIGLTAEKDPGEQFFKGAQKYGFDFYSFHLYYHGGKYLKTVVIGDYQVQIGQGLNLWTGYAFRKTADVANIKRNALPIKAYTSADEARFLRGAATELGYKDFSLLLFGSYKKMDGSVFSDTLEEQDLNLVTSINLTGLHRTTSEIAKRNSLGEAIAGTNLKYGKRNFNVGVAAVYQGYDKPYQREISPYNQYSFRGQHKVSLSADYNYIWRNLNIFGEVSSAGHGGEYAVIQGAILAIDSRATISTFYRNFSRGYGTSYNNAMSEWSNTQNEEGIYLGLNVKLTDAWNMSSYYDIFRRKWLSFGADAPSKGHEFLFQVNYKPTRKMEVYARYRQQLKQINGATMGDGSITELDNENHQNYRLNFSYQVTDNIRIASRIEFVQYRTPTRGNNKGLLLQQDIIFRPKSFPLDVTARLALFDTDSYYSRIYSFEANALYTYSIPSYYYQGTRAYFLIRYTFLRKFNVWVKYGQFIYSNRKSTGSGPETIQGGTKSDITVQLRMTF